MERFDLSGIYIFDTLDGEDGRKPTCIEDCNRDTRVAWLKSLSKEALLKTFSIILQSYEKMANILNEEELVYIIDVMCMQLHGDAKYFGITANIKDE